MLIVQALLLTGDSHLGITFSLVINNLISWKNKKQMLWQNYVQNQNIEPWPKALATYELTWLKQLLKELTFSDGTQMTLIWDNQVA